MCVNYQVDKVDAQTKQDKILPSNYRSSKGFTTSNMDNNSVD